MSVAGSIDTCVALRVIVGDVPEQRAAALDLLGQGRFMLANAAVAELVYGLTRWYGHSRQQAAELTLAFMDQPSIKTTGVAKRAMVNYALHPKLSFEDCLILQEALDSDAGSLWTFDRKLANQTEARLLQAEGSADGE